MTRRGRVLLLVGLVFVASGVAGSVGSILALGVAACSVVVLAAITSPRPGPLSASITIPRTRVVAGDVVAATVSVHNDGDRRSRPVGAVLELADGPRELSVPRLEAGASSTRHVSLPTLTRGTKQIGPVHLTHRDGLGLIGATARLSEPVELVVHPRSLPLDIRSPSLLRSPDGLGGAGPRSHELSMSRVRDYQAGDDRRFVHWATSARLGRLMVREDVAPTSVSLTVVLDGRADRWDARRYEHAVGVVASFVESCHRSGAHLRVLLDADPIEIAAVDPLAATVGLDRLADVEPLAGAVPWWDLVTGLAGSLVVVGGRFDESDWQQARELTARVPVVVLTELVGSTAPRGAMDSRVVHLRARSLDEFGEQWRRAG